MRKLVVAILACWLFGIAGAAERNPLDARFIVDAGTFLMSTDTSVRVDGETSGMTGTDIDFENTFGIGDFDRFRAEALWRIADRHALRGLYFENNRSGTRPIDLDINFGDQRFPAGASVTARSEVSIAQLSYQYAFLRRENYELAGSVGVHYVDMELSLAGRGAEIAQDENATTEAPLPMLGLHGLWRLPNNFYLTAQVQYFYLELDPYSGSLLDLKASLVWQFTDHVGIGVAYNDFGFRFDIEDEGEFDGRLRWDYGGVIAFATFMF